MNLNNEEEVLGLLTRLLDQLRQADLKNFGSKIEIVYVASGGQHVEKQINIGALQPLPNPPRRRGDGHAEKLPAPDAMVWAVEKTINDGHWWGNVSWSVVYRIYQMKGYQGTVSQFVRDVSQWPFTMHIRYDCNDDAVGKPIRTRL